MNSKTLEDVINSNPYICPFCHEEYIIRKGYTTATTNPYPHRIENFQCPNSHTWVWHSHSECNICNKE